MNTTLTCICGTSNAFGANQFAATCAGCGVLLVREEPESLYGAEPAVFTDVRTVAAHAAIIAADRAEDDHEAADSRERRLFEAVLRAVIEGAPNAAELARAALGE